MATPPIVRSGYLVEGLSSTSCAAKIAAALKRLPGVLDVSVSACAGTVVVEHLDDGMVSTNVERQVRALGHRIVGLSQE